MCHEQSLSKPGTQAALQILRSVAFHEAVNQLSGYSAIRCGDVETLKEAFPDFKPRRRNARAE
jgi:hypothetical protein